MNKDVNNVGIRHDRPMTILEVETTAANMRAVDRSLNWRPSTTPIGKFFDKVWIVLWCVIALIILFTTIFT